MVPCRKEFSFSNIDTTKIQINWESIQVLANLEKSNKNACRSSWLLMKLQQNIFILNVFINYVIKYKFT